MAFVKPLPSGRVQIYAFFPVLVMMTAFILSFLCLFAGHKTGFMEDYAIFTLNTSRIGQNLIEDFDGKILALNFSNLPTRSDEMIRPAVTITAEPTATITMAPRFLSDLVGHISSDAGAAKSDVDGKVSQVESAAVSKASAVESAAASKVDGALAAAETAIVNAVNKAYENLIEELDLQDFYSIHIMSSCSGAYQYHNGSNVTVGAGPTPANNTHEHVYTCEKHSVLDPVSVVRVLYEVGIVLTGIAFFLGIFGAVRFSRKIAFLNALGTLPALMFIGLASAAVHGVAVGAQHLINFAGRDIGISGYAGTNFINLTWATTILLLVNVAVWSGLAFLAEKLPQPVKSQQDPAYDEGNEMKARRPKGANSWYIRGPQQA